MKCKKCKPPAEMDKVKQYKNIDDVILQKNFKWILKCPYCGRKQKFRFGQGKRWGENNEMPSMRT